MTFPMKDIMISSTFRIWEGIIVPLEPFIISTLPFYVRTKSVWRKVIFNFGFDNRKIYPLMYRKLFSIRNYVVAKLFSLIKETKSHFIWHVFPTWRSQVSFLLVLVPIFWKLFHIVYFENYWLFHILYFENYFIPLRRQRDLFKSVSL